MNFTISSVSPEGTVANREETGGIGAMGHQPAYIERETEKQNMLSMFVHDMKNPVTTAGSSVSRLLAGKIGLLTDTQRESLSLIKQSLNKLDTLLIQFLDFLRIGSKEYEPVFYPLDIVFALSRNIEDVKVLAEKKHLDIRFEYPEMISPVYADLMMITRIITNLLDNAIKYTGSGGMITVRVQDGDDSVTIQIADTGIGISDNHIREIFNPFYRIRRDSEGSGLGLFIVKTMVEAHKGKISVISIPGKGSTFSFTLPRQIGMYSYAA
jgi:two-component system, OmpR family, phosphate regulon sensor histidine kinase PhoR